MTPQRPHPECETCNAYFARRVLTLPAAIVHYARLRGMTPNALLVEFAHGVHARHLAGLSLGAGS